MDAGHSEFIWIEVNLLICKLSHSCFRCSIVFIQEVRDPLDSDRCVSTYVQFTLRLLQTAVKMLSLTLILWSPVCSFSCCLTCSMAQVDGKSTQRAFKSATLGYSFFPNEKLFHVLSF